jgi:hypothetical protein
VRKPSPSLNITSTSYGLVMAPPPEARPAPAFEIHDVGPVRIREFQSVRRRAGHVLLAVLVLAVVGAILATILSYQLNV